MLNQTFIGIDFGLANTGIAVGQTITATASALKTIHNQGKFNWEELDKIIQQWQPNAIVIGNPLTESGEEQETTRQVANFAKKVTSRYQLPVHLVDERFSSMLAQKEFAEARKSGNAKKKHAENLDSHAAKIILQRWLDSL
ncbi:MAG: Holliday junction resolvase RuvX [Gammaproteobacteria bacterium]|jgi:putative Holliday junction resolvase